MEDKFLHRTIRAEWYVFEHAKLPIQHGPYPSQRVALGIMEIMKPRTKNKLSLHYNEVAVEIDPIVSDAVNSISEMIQGWFKSHLKQKTKNSGYIHENIVARSLLDLSNEVKKTFVTNMENPHDSSKDQQR